MSAIETRKAERLAWRERLKEDFASILERDIHTIESSEDGGPLGNNAWFDHIYDTISAATGKPIPWLAIELAVLLDRMVREAELLESPND